MLRKLVKHEFRATAQVMLPLYLVVAVLALGTRAMSAWAQAVAHQTSAGWDFVNFMFGLTSIGFGLGLVAVFVVAFVLMILRFRSNLMADEGYVMFTLPASTHQLVWSKLIVSTVWFLGACVMDALALLLLAADRAFFGGLGQFMSEMFQDLTAYYVSNGMAFALELLLLLILGCIVVCLTFYTPLSIGHGFARHKMLLSVVFFFVIEIATQVLGGIALTAGIPALPALEGFVNGLTPVGMTHWMMWAGIVTSAIYGAVLYLITIRMLHRHLNLE